MAINSLTWLYLSSLVNFSPHLWGGSDLKVGGIFGHHYTTKPNGRTSWEIYETDGQIRHGRQDDVGR